MNLLWKILTLYSLLFYVAMVEGSVGLLSEGPCMTCFAVSTHFERRSLSPLFFIKAKQQTRSGNKGTWSRRLLLLLTVEGWRVGNTTTLPGSSK
jgi:hypothetical protein